MGIKERITWQRLPVRALRIDHPGKEARFWLGYCVLYFFAAILTGWLIRTWPYPFLGAISVTQDSWYVVFFKLFLLLVVPLVANRRMGYGVADLTPGWRLGQRSLTPIVIGYALGFALNLGHLDLYPTARANFSGAAFWAIVAFSPVLAFLMAGFPEEFVFRGLLQTRLEATRGRFVAIFLTAILFTAWHIPTRYFNSQGIEGQAGNLPSVLLGTGVPVFIVGLIFGLIWDRYRSFWPLVACHTGVDTLPIITSFLGIPR